MGWICTPTYIDPAQHFITAVTGSTADDLYDLDRHLYDLCDRRLSEVRKFWYRCRRGKRRGSDSTVDTSKVHHTTASCR